MPEALAALRAGEWFGARMNPLMDSLYHIIIINISIIISIIIIIIIITITFLQASRKVFGQ